MGIWTGLVGVVGRHRLVVVLGGLDGDKLSDARLALPRLTMATSNSEEASEEDTEGEGEGERELEPRVDEDAQRTGLTVTVTLLSAWVACACFLELLVLLRLVLRGEEEAGSSEETGLLLACCGCVGGEDGMPCLGRLDQRRDLIILTDTVPGPAPLVVQGRY